MTYTYNRESKSFGIYTNFKPEILPSGYEEITKEEYEELTVIEEPNEENEEV